MRLLIALTVLILSTSAAWCQDLKPELKSEDVLIQNTFKTPGAPQVIAAQPIDLNDLSTVVAAKEQKRIARVEANRQLDLQYKAIPNKPSRWRHPIKRTDLWADYHQDAMRKYRTRALPIGQGLATVLGMGFAAGAAFR